MDTIQNKALAIDEVRVEDKIQHYLTIEIKLNESTNHAEAITKALEFTSPLGLLMALRLTNNRW